MTIYFFLIILTMMIYTECVRMHILKVERSLAIEAYRLRCSNLFGNRCMSRTIFGALSKKTCDGNCWYLNQFKLELYKLET